MFVDQTVQELYYIWKCTQQQLLECMALSLLLPPIRSLNQAKPGCSFPELG